MSGSDYERELKTLLTEAGFHVVRSAGSLGEADLYVITPHQTIPLECKSTKKRRFGIDRPTLREQRDGLWELCRYGLYAMYAFRLKDGKNTPVTEKWRFYPVRRDMKSILWDKDEYYTWEELLNVLRPGEPKNLNT